MFKTILKADKVFTNKKTGKVVNWKKDANISVSTYLTYKNDKPEQRPMYATVTNLDNREAIVHKMANLYRLSDDFIKPTEEMINEAMMDSVIESMTGERIEPDGYDEYGLPSILMAMGLM